MNNLKPEEKEERRREFKKRRIAKIQEILDYAEEKYSCEFQKNFARKLYYLAPEKWLEPPKSVIDALVAEWKIWRPYVNPQSFTAFIEDGLISIYTIKATATFSFPEAKGYIGVKATIIKELPPQLSTCVSLNGMLHKNGIQVPVE